MHSILLCPCGSSSLVSRLLLHCMTAGEEPGDETSGSGGHMMVGMDNKRLMLLTDYESDLCTCPTVWFHPYMLLFSFRKLFCDLYITWVQAL